MGAGERRNILPTSDSLPSLSFPPPTPAGTWKRGGLPGEVLCCGWVGKPEEALGQGGLDRGTARSPRSGHIAMTGRAQSAKIRTRPRPQGAEGRAPRAGGGPRRGRPRRGRRNVDERRGDPVRGKVADSGSPPAPGPGETGGVFLAWVREDPRGGSRKHAHAEIAPLATTRSLCRAAPAGEQERTRSAAGRAGPGEIGQGRKQARRPTTTLDDGALPRGR